MVSTFKTDEATSQRMKAVIDHYDCVIGNYKDKVKMYEQAIENIKAEIEQLNPVDYGSMFSYESHNGARDMKEDIIKIIDRHIGERSE